MPKATISDGENDVVIDLTALRQLLTYWHTDEATSMADAAIYADRFIDRMKEECQVLTPDKAAERDREFEEFMKP